MSMYLGNDEPTQEYAVEALSELITIQSIQVGTNFVFLKKDINYSKTSFWEVHLQIYGQKFSLTACVSGAVRWDFQRYIQLYLLKWTFWVWLSHSNALLQLFAVKIFVSSQIGLLQTA